MVRTLGADWCTRWREGLPEYLETPGNINLTEILRLWTYAEESLDLVPWGKRCATTCWASCSRHWFPGESAAKMDELDLREAIRQNPFAAATFPKSRREAHQMLYEKLPVKRLSET